MEQEQFLSGYCRTLDCSRMVCVITQNQSLVEVDCSYECCPFVNECTVAKEITALLK